MVAPLEADRQRWRELDAELAERRKELDERRKELDEELARVIDQAKRDAPLHAWAKFLQLVALTLSLLNNSSLSRHRLRPRPPAKRCPRPRLPTKHRPTPHRPKTAGICGNSIGAPLKSAKAERAGPLICGRLSAKPLSRWPMSKMRPRGAVNFTKLQPDCLHSL